MEAATCAPAVLTRCTSLNFAASPERALKSGFIVYASVGERSKDMCQYGGLCGPLGSKAVLREQSLSFVLMLLGLGLFLQPRLVLMLS